MFGFFILSFKENIDANKAKCQVRIDTPAIIKLCLLMAKRLRIPSQHMTINISAFINDNVCEKLNMTSKKIRHIFINKGANTNHNCLTAPHHQP